MVPLVRSYPDTRAGGTLPIHPLKGERMTPAKAPEKLTEREQLRKDRPDTWIAVNEGDTLRGVVMDIDVAYSDVQAQGASDGWYPLLTVKVTSADGYEPGKELKVHGFATVLHNEILKREPAPGEDIIIRYDGVGESKTKGRSAPSLYRVRVPNRDPAETARKTYGMLSRRGAPLPAPAPAPVSESVPSDPGAGSPPETDDDIPW